MSAFPDDIFTEPSDINPDALANLGPLRRLAGVWEGKGADIAPKAAGPERKEFAERIVFELIDPQANGPQLFYGLRYHTRIFAKGEEPTFHDQVGYWLWEPATGLIMQTLAIPRGQIAMASGQATPDSTRLILTAERGKTDYGICSTTFLEHAFRTDSYRIEINFNADGSWSYILDTMLLVRGRTEPFLHRDVNTLFKVADPEPNPLLQPGLNRGV